MKSIKTTTTTWNKQQTREKELISFHLVDFRFTNGFISKDGKFISVRNIKFWIRAQHYHTQTVVYLRVDVSSIDMMGTHIYNITSNSKRTKYTAGLASIFTYFAILTY